MSGAFDEKGNVRLSERVKALPPWPIMGYDMPRTMQGVEVVTLFKKEIFGFIISIKRKQWGERRVIPE
jgi:hypothetical protein